MLLEFDGTFIFALVSFIMFMLIMNLILYKPVMKVISERQKFIDKNHNIVASSKQKAQNVIKEKDEAINSAKKEAHMLLSKTSIDVKNKKNEAIKLKSEQVREGIVKQNEILTKEENEARIELKNEVENFVKDVTFKILDKDIEIKIDDNKLNEILKIER